jgi:TonB family protein
MINMVMEHLVRGVIALTVSALLFLMLPMIQRLFDNKPVPEESAFARRPLVAARYAPPPPPPRSQVRERSTGFGRGRHADGARTQLQFSPDLAVGGTGAGISAGGGMETAVYSEGDVDNPPRLLSAPSIPYPPQAREFGISGRVVVDIVVSRTGRVEEVNIVESPHPSFDKVVSRVVKVYRFHPAFHQGVPVRTRVRQELDFQLED